VRDRRPASHGLTIGTASIGLDWPNG
jgi:hypothetical protein